MFCYSNVIQTWAVAFSPHKVRFIKWNVILQPWRNFISWNLKMRTEWELLCSWTAQVVNFARHACVHYEGCMLYGVKMILSKTFGRFKFLSLFPARQRFQGFFSRVFIHWCLSVFFTSLFYSFFLFGGRLYCQKNRSFEGSDRKNSASQRLAWNEFTLLFYLRTYCWLRCLLCLTQITRHCLSWGL